MGAAAGARVGEDRTEFPAGAGGAGTAGSAGAVIGREEATEVVLDIGGDGRIAGVPTERIVGVVGLDPALSDGDGICEGAVEGNMEGANDWVREIGRDGERELRGGMRQDRERTEGEPGTAGGEEISRPERVESSCW